MEEFKPLIAYVAGRYRANTKLGVIRNIYRAWKVGKDLWRMGYYAVVPHTNAMLYDNVAPEVAFLDGDIEIMKRSCDFVVLVPGWENSKGTQGEVKLAREWGMHVYEWPNVPKPQELRDYLTILKKVA